MNAPGSSQGRFRSANIVILRTDYTTDYNSYYSSLAHLPLCRRKSGAGSRAHRCTNVCFCCWNPRNLQAPLLLWAPRHRTLHRPPRRWNDPINAHDPPFRHSSTAFLDSYKISGHLTGQIASYGSGRVGSGRVGSGRVGSGRVGSHPGSPTRAVRCLEASCPGPTRSARYFKPPDPTRIDPTSFVKNLLTGPTGRILTRKKRCKILPDIFCFPINLNHQHVHQYQVLHKLYLGYNRLKVGSYLPGYLRGGVSNSFLHLLISPPCLNSRHSRGLKPTTSIVDLPQVGSQPYEMLRPMSAADRIRLW